MFAAFHEIAFYVNPLLCEFLEGLLLWRLSLNHSLRRYPYLSVFLLYDFIRTPMLLIVATLWHSAFRWTYWTTDTPAQFLQFLIIWEVARALFPPDTSLRRVSWTTLLIAEAFVIPVSVALCWGQASLVRFANKPLPYIFEQYSSLAQALLLLAIAVVARYYRIPLGRTMRGLIFSFGPYLLLDSLSFAGDEVFGRFASLLELLPAMIFTGMIAVWLWAFWKPAPAEQQEVACYDHAALKQQWNHLWQTTLNVARRWPN